MRRRTAAALLLVVGTIGLAYAAADVGDASVGPRIAGVIGTLALGLLLLAQMRGRANSDKHRRLASIAKLELVQGSRGSNDVAVTEEDAARSSIEVCEELPEVEQAKVLLSFGRTQEAAQALAAISAQPAESAASWIRQSTGRSGPSASAFNVDPARDASGCQSSLEDYPHILNEVVRRWRQPDCAVYLDCLLLDTRKGSRKGFPIAVAEELILLRRLLRERIA